MDKVDKLLLTNLKRQRTKLLNSKNIKKHSFEDIQEKLNLIEFQIKELTEN